MKSIKPFIYLGLQIKSLKIFCEPIQSARETQRVNDDWEAAIHNFKLAKEKWASLYNNNQELHINKVANEIKNTKL